MLLSLKGRKGLFCLAALLAAFTTAHAQTVIMPLGDSITWGYNGSVTDPATPGGYRDPLYTELTNAGHSVSFTGVNNDNPSPTLTSAGQTGHNGFNAYRIDEIDANLNGNSPTNLNSNLGGYWLTGGNGTGRGPANANVILLQIGTNDIVQGYDPIFNPSNPFDTAAESATDFAAHLTLRLENLINDIRLYEPNAALLVAGITPIDGWNYKVNPYIADVQNLIASNYAGQNIFYVDMNSPFYSGTNQNLSLFVDGVHPTTEGYDLMADQWALALQTDVFTIPEPSALPLLALGGLSLFALRRKLRPPLEGQPPRR